MAHNQSSITSTFSRKSRLKNIQQIFNGTCYLYQDPAGIVGFQEKFVSGLRLAYILSLFLLILMKFLKFLVIAIDPRT